MEIHALQAAVTRKLSSPRARLADSPTRLSAKGARVFLRPPKQSDRDEFLALRRENRAWLARFEARAWPTSRPGELRAFLAVLDCGPGTSRERWLVCEAGGGAILGAITIGTIRGQPFDSATLGYWISKDKRGRGLMGEALAIVLRHAFRTLRLNRLEAEVLTDNRASQRLLRRAGFRREGIAREFACVAGEFRDHQRWALLAREHAVARAQRPQSRR